MSITLKERPIFVLGCHRSGTTMLMLMIGAHPRISVPEVAWYYQRFRPYLYSYGNLNDEANFRTLADEMVNGLIPPYFGMDVNPATIVDEIMADAKERSFAGIFDAVLERHAREDGNKPRWAEKSPNNSFFVKEILEDFPNAQFVYITRDGRDNCAETLHSRHGLYNMVVTAERWKLFLEAVKPWREKLTVDQWLDIKYEDLARRPEAILGQVCDFIGEEYSPSMLDFHQSDVAQTRARVVKNPGGVSPAPLAEPVSDRFIGVYKELLSVKDQRIFAAIAGDVQTENGYELDYEPEEMSEEALENFREQNGRMRAALLHARGHMRDSYIEWLVDQREVRKRQGIWTDADVPDQFPIGDPNEDTIMGRGAPRKWKTEFGIPRRYY